jgi:hypothetical protein
VADGRDRLARLEEGPGERDRVLIQPERVRIGHAARKHQPVVVAGIGVPHGEVGGEGVALVEMVEALDGPCLERDHVHLRTGRFDGLARLGVLDLLDPVGHQEGDPLALQLGCHS